MTDEHSDNSDRRRQTRYSPGDLKLTIAYPGLKGMLRSNPIVECTDFNATGLQFTTSKRFHLDDRVVIDLCIKEECLYELMGMVCYTRRIDDGYQCGVRFCSEDRRMQAADVQHTLRKIESSLKSDAEYPESQVP